MLFLTPLSMLISITRNSRQLIDRLALALGLIIGPILAATKIGLDLMWTGIIAGTIAHVVHRLREAMQSIRRWTSWVRIWRSFSWASCPTRCGAGSDSWSPAASVRILRSSYG